MNQAELLDYLLEDGPPPPAAVLADLFEEDVPEELAQRTLNLVAIERTRPPVAQQNWKNRIWKSGLLVTLAAGLLLVIQTKEDTSPLDSTSNQVNPLEGMQAKGEEQSAPKVSLKISANQNGNWARHRTDANYGPGDALAFRVQSDAAGSAYLIRADQSSIQVVLETEIRAGEADLALPNGQLAQWKFESKDRSAVFAVVSTTEKIDPQQLQTQIGENLGVFPPTASAFCLAAESLGCQCDAIEVMVSEQ